MTEADESKVTRPAAEAGAETLSARIRREGDLSSRAGQLDRLYALADEADTLRAQLEAAEQVIAEAAVACGQAQARAEAAEAECKWLRVAMDCYVAHAGAARTKEAAL